MKYKIFVETYEIKNIFWNLKLIKKRDDDNLLLIRTSTEGTITIFDEDFHVFKDLAGQEIDAILREEKDINNYKDYKIKLKFQNKINFEKTFLVASIHIYEPVEKLLLNYDKKVNLLDFGDIKRLAFNPAIKGNFTDYNFNIIFAFDFKEVIQNYVNQITDGEVNNFEFDLPIEMFLQGDGLHRQNYIALMDCLEQYYWGSGGNCEDFANFNSFIKFKDLLDDFKNILSFYWGIEGDTMTFQHGFIFSLDTLMDFTNLENLKNKTFNYYDFFRKIIIESQDDTELWGKREIFFDIFNEKEKNISKNFDANLTLDNISEKKGMELFSIDYDTISINYAYDDFFNPLTYKGYATPTKYASSNSSVLYRLNLDWTILTSKLILLKKDEIIKISFKGKFANDTRIKFYILDHLKNSIIPNSAGYYELQFYANVEQDIIIPDLTIPNNDYYFIRIDTEHSELGDYLDNFKLYLENQATLVWGTGEYDYENFHLSMPYILKNLKKDYELKRAWTFEEGDFNTEQKFVFFREFLYYFHDFLKDLDFNKPIKINNLKYRIKEIIREVKEPLKYVDRIKIESQQLQQQPT